MKAYKIFTSFFLFFTCIYPKLGAEEQSLHLLEEKALQGSGHVIEEERSLPFFNRVNFSGNFLVDIQIDEKQDPLAQIRCDDNLFPWIDTRVEKNTLFIHYRSPESQDPLLPPSFNATSIHSSTPPHIFLSMQEVVEIAGQGSSQLQLKALNGKELLLKFSGSSTAKLEGILDTLDLRLSGSSKLDAKSLMCNSVVFNLSGSSQAQLMVKDSLKGKSAGSSTVEYLGNPSFTKVESMGASHIKSIE